jgi:preprotein translocase subunit SecE
MDAAAARSLGKTTGMVKDNEATVRSTWGWFDAGIYKRTQGRVARQVTFFALAIGLAWGLYRLSEQLIGLRLSDSASNYQRYIQYGVPGVLLIIGLWLCYRLVNLPRFADFLIGVEAEMNKVSWPTQSELIRSSLVVMFTIFSLAVLLFLYDLFWRALLRLIGVTN